MPAKQRQELLRTLEQRFDAHPDRHPSLAGSDVVARLEARPDKRAALAEMERTGGEPDVVRRDAQSGAVVLMDGSPESPAGRRSVCYDREGRLSRKEARPEATPLDLAAEMGIELLTEAQYLDLQKLDAFDTDTPIRVTAPPETRNPGGARSDNAVRGFRATLTG